MQAKNLRISYVINENVQDIWCAKKLTIAQLKYFGIFDWHVWVYGFPALHELHVWTIKLLVAIWVSTYI